MLKKKTARNIAILSALIILIPFVAADSYELWCLGKGELLDLPSLCNPLMKKRTGPINICMHLLDNGKICPASPNVCNNLGLGCSASQNTTLDQTPPNLTILNPVEGLIYNERAISLVLDVDEKSDIYYLDNINGRGVWKQVCRGCFSYSSKRSFNEGFNNLTFRARDTSNNEAYQDITFTIDSKKPKIKTTEPKKGFTSGDFYIKFDEKNPSSLILNYGTPSNMKQYPVNINSQCINNKYYECNFNIPLTEFDGQQISYFFELKDIADSMVTSKPVSLDVDFSPPVINSIDYTVNGKYLYITLDITEPYLDKVTYLDTLDNKPKVKTLCTKLNNNLCEKKISFKDGQHDLTINVIDEAGNSVSASIQFFTDSKKPKLKSVEPRRGFASGDFYVKFDEENPVSLVLQYGNYLTGVRNKSIDLNTCTLGKRYYECSTSVNLDEYDGQEIEYTFTLTDRVGQSATSKPVNLEVDITFPVINSINYTIDRNYAYLVLNITEINFDEAVYRNNNDRRPRETRLCSRLKDGICEKRIRLNEGDNNIDIQVFDEAGNSIGQSILITLS